MWYMGGVVLCSVVTEVEFACGPEVSELLLLLSATDPVEVRVHGLVFVCNDSFVG